MHRFASNANYYQLQYIITCVLLIMIIIFQYPPSTQAQLNTIRVDDPIAESCSNKTGYDGDENTYKSGSQFETNLKTVLFPSLISNATLNNGFLSTTAGDTVDPIYGLAQCRGDVSMDQCKTCLNDLSVYLLSNCPLKTAGVVFNYCLIRYSNTKLLPQVTQVVKTIWINETVSDPVVLNQHLGDLLTNLTSVAVSKIAKFETGTVMFNDNYDTITIFGMVQCTQDLSNTDCSTCLKAMINQIPTGKKEGLLVTWSCLVRFAQSPFYGSSPSVPLQPPPNGRPSDTGDASSSRNTIAIIAAAIGGALFVLALCAYFLRRRKMGRKTINPDSSHSTIIIDNGNDDIAINHLERATSMSTSMSTSTSLQYDLVTIRIATKDFAVANKLGEGGFGAVYKGELSNGQEIAAKRLSGSRQGSEEFENEVNLLHKLQHRNLVRFLGFCLEGEEKILIYEYVPNRSLDNYLFDPTRKANLDWPTRYKIIRGIARGLLYLHEDSRLRIIHMDLKAGNILLDGEMNPKVADFGMAKLFNFDQTRGNTSRIAGTFGYMAPEYALHGLFSVKSDVFSFGVLLLEIVSGQRISSFHQLSAPSHNLLTYAWKHWREGTALESLMDPILRDSYVRNEVMTSIHIGLLCVQDNIEDRPTMSSIVSILNSLLSSSISLPTEPAFFGSRSRTTSIGLWSGANTERNYQFTSDHDLYSSKSNSISYSANDLSVIKTRPR